MSSMSGILPIPKSTGGIQSEPTNPDGARDGDGNSSHTVERNNVIDSELSGGPDNFGLSEVKNDDKVDNSPRPDPGTGTTDDPYFTHTSAPSVSPVPASPSTSKRRGLKMPDFSSLSNLILHSPSSQIVGTPFATNTTRYEYPFPESSNASPSSGGGTPPAGGILGLGIPSFPGMASSSPSSSSAQVSSFPQSPEMPQYNTTHPKLKAPTNPPIPPSLVRKRNRWSLNLLGRRKSTSGQSSGEDSTSSNLGIDGVLAGPQLSSPLSSPTEEKGKR